MNTILIDWSPWRRVAFCGANHFEGNQIWNAGALTIARLIHQIYTKKKSSERPNPHLIGGLRLSQTSLPHVSFPA